MFFLYLILFGGCGSRCGSCSERGSNVWNGCNNYDSCNGCVQITSNASCGGYTSCCRSKACTGFGSNSGVCSDRAYYMRQYALCGCDH